MARKNGSLWVKAYIRGLEDGKKKQMEQQNKGGCLSVIILVLGLGGLLSLMIKIL